MKKIVLLYGGQSPEHDISLLSASSVLFHIDRNKYHVIPIAITPQGKWYLNDAKVQYFRASQQKPLTIETNIPVYIIPQEGFFTSKGRIPLDYIMPIMHGSYAEDGSIQGILSSLPFPYTCTNVSSAALTINKILTKKILHDSCIPVLPTYRIDKQDIKDSHSKNKILKEISERFPFPLFVKPSSGGSSQGISKVKSHQKLIPAIELALELDSMVLVEPALIDRQEIEVAVTGNEDITTYTPAEIITSYEFYDYTAKYINPASTNFFLPAHINKNMIKQIQLYARQAYKAVGCSIMARVDFLIDTQKQQIYVNEINTIPGFTTISMFPRMLMHDGISYPQIIELLIQLAIARQCTNSINTTSRIQ